MLGPRQEAQAALFYEFSLEDHVLQDHLLRSIDRFVDLTSIRAHLEDFYSQVDQSGLSQVAKSDLSSHQFCEFLTSLEQRFRNLNFAFHMFSEQDHSFGVAKVAVV